MLRSLVPILIIFCRVSLSPTKEQILLAFEQSEKEVIDSYLRTKEGIKTARLNDNQIGQVPEAKLHTKKSETAKTMILKYSNQIKLGDVAFIDFNGDGLVQHATICTKVENGIPYYCAHSKCRKIRNMILTTSETHM